MPDGTATVGTRERIMRGAVRCVERVGVSGFSLEDVAAEAGVSRTSIYRYFPGGRSQLVQETATWEVGRFWAGLAEAVAELDSLEDRLVRGLALGTRQIRRSPIMANLMDPDLDELVEALQPAEPLVQGVMREYMVVLLEREREAGRLREGVSVADGADYLTRMILSVMGSPAGVDMADEAQARAVVRREFLAGIVDLD
ncbi:MAG: TetR/AcrR family transcriptional regulator [Actinomycetia bacterium]|nr:TetR/AcrR family transcriptional regulator [Actinomycetes bacterium]